MSGPPNTGVLVTAHGTVEDLAHLPQFLKRIRRGHPAPPGLLNEVRRRYQIIGGSPLLETTRTLTARLAERLEVPTFLGMRLWAPELADALVAASRQAVRRLAVLPLAPFSVPVYFEAAERARDQLGLDLELASVEPWGTEETLVIAHANLIRPLLEAHREGTELILTAHSLPMAVVNAGDPYATEVEAGASAVAERLGFPFRLAYQSQGASPGAWLGPDLKSVLELSAASGKPRVLVAPIGFLGDHVETLYDLDIEARGWAEHLGLQFARAPALNTDPGLLDAMARVAERALFR